LEKHKGLILDKTSLLPLSGLPYVSISAVLFPPFFLRQMEATGVREFVAEVTVFSFSSIFAPLFLISLPTKNPSVTVTFNFPFSGSQKTSI